MSKFQVGDKVVVIDAKGASRSYVGQRLTVNKVIEEYYNFEEVPFGLYGYRFEKVEEKVSEFKKGDRVRLTLGASVIEGVMVSNASPHHLSVRPDLVTKEYNIFYYRDGWTVELLGPSVPKNVGAVVQFNKEPYVWVRKREDYWESTNMAITASDADMTRFFSTYTTKIIFEGVPA